MVLVLRGRGRWILSSRPVWSAYTVSSRPGIHSKTSKLGGRCVGVLSMKRIKMTFGPLKTLGFCARFTAVLGTGLGAFCMPRPILYSLGYISSHPVLMTVYCSPAL